MLRVELSLLQIVVARSERWFSDRMSEDSEGIQVDWWTQRPWAQGRRARPPAHLPGMCRQ